MLQQFIFFLSNCCNQCKWEEQIYMKTVELMLPTMYQLQRKVVQKSKSRAGRYSTNIYQWVYIQISADLNNIYIISFFVKTVGIIDSLINVINSLKIVLLVQRRWSDDKCFIGNTKTRNPAIRVYDNYIQISTIFTKLRTDFHQTIEMRHL